MRRLLTAGILVCLLATALPPATATPTDDPVTEDGFWCGRCGDGPFEKAIDVEDHHQDAHGRGNAIAMEYDPEESELAGDVADSRPFRDWNGGDGAHATTKKGGQDA